MNTVLIGHVPRDKNVIQLYTYMCVCVCARARIHIHTHTHTHTSKSQVGKSRKKPCKHHFRHLL